MKPIWHLYLAQKSEREKPQRQARWDTCILPIGIYIPS